MKTLALWHLKCLYSDSTTRWQSQRNDRRWMVWGNPTLTNPQPKIDFLIELCRSMRPVYWQDPGGSYLEGLPLSHVVFRQEQLLIFTKKLGAHTKKKRQWDREVPETEGEKQKLWGNNKVIWTLHVVVFVTASASCHNTVSRKLERFPPRRLKANWCSRPTNDLPDQQPDAAARLPDCLFQRRAVCLISPNRSKGKPWHRNFL